MELHGCRGCGSAAIEALLELAGLDYRRHLYDWDDRLGWDRLRAVNPLAQVPTLVLDDGSVLTESAGIALWIAASHPAARLLPDDPGERALVFRWVVSFATNVYVPIIVGDFPERWVDAPASESVKAHALRRLQDAWRSFDAAIAPSPYLVGDRLSVLDVYAAMISRWRPGRAWIAEHCAKATGAILLTEADPRVAAVWARNFD